MKEVVGEIPDKEVYKQMFHVTKEDCARMQKIREDISRLHSRESLLRVEKMIKSGQETK